MSILRVKRHGKVSLSSIKKKALLSVSVYKRVVLYLPPLVYKKRRQRRLSYSLKLLRQRKLHLKKSLKILRTKYTSRELETEK